MYLIWTTSLTSTDIEKGHPSLAKDLDIWQQKWKKTLVRDTEPAVQNPSMVDVSATDIVIKL